MSHWATQYIGAPWVAGTHDCWAFARRVWREQFGMDVPAVAFDAASALSCRKALESAEERGHWQSVSPPREGDAVLMGKNARPAHVGIWLDTCAGRVLHCVEGAGVVCNDLMSLRNAGWLVLGYYRRLA